MPLAQISNMVRELLLQTVSTRLAFLPILLKLIPFQSVVGANTTRATDAAPFMMDDSSRNATGGTDTKPKDDDAMINDDPAECCALVPWSKPPSSETDKYDRSFRVDFFNTMIRILVFIAFPVVILLLLVRYLHFYFRFSFTDHTFVI